MTIHLPTGRRRLRNVTVKVNGRKVKVIQGKRPRVVISLVGRPGTTVTVVITGRSGKHRYRSVRHYFPCRLA